MSFVPRLGCSRTLFLHLLKAAFGFIFGSLRFIGESELVQTGIRNRLKAVFIFDRVHSPTNSGLLSAVSARFTQA